MRRFALGFAAGILTLPLAAVVSAWLGLLPTTAISNPSRWEGMFAQMALNSYVGRHAPHVTDPISDTDENPLAGLAVYRDACAGCHGDSSGSSAFGADFYPRVPQFATHPPQLPDWQLFWIIEHGVRYSGMPAWAGQWHHDKPTSDDRMWKVATFLSRLNSLPPAVETEWHRRR